MHRVVTYGHGAAIAVAASARSSGTLAIDGPIRTRRMNGGRVQRNTAQPAIVTFSPKG
jgi:hypothetical protein